MIDEKRRSGLAAGRERPGRLRAQGSLRRCRGSGAGQVAPIDEELPSWQALSWPPSWRRPSWQPSWRRIVWHRQTSWRPSWRRPSWRPSWRRSLLGGLLRADLLGGPLLGGLLRAGLLDGPLRRRSSSRWSTSWRSSSTPVDFFALDFFAVDFRAAFFAVAITFLLDQVAHGTAGFRRVVGRRLFIARELPRRGAPVR